MGGGPRKRYEFLKAVRGEFTAKSLRLRELSAYTDQDVEQKLRATCDISRVDVGDQFSRFNERQQSPEKGIVEFCQRPGTDVWGK